MMAIEIYNKPSIKYRVEGFALFICNALGTYVEAHLIKKMVWIVFIIKTTQTEP